jgi:hypothetical protein
MPEGYQAQPLTLSFLQVTILCDGGKAAKHGKCVEWHEWCIHKAATEEAR